MATHETIDPLADTLEAAVKRLVLILSHPRVVLLLGTAFAVGIAVQVWWRGAYLLAGLFLCACLGAAAAG